MSAARNPGPMRSVAKAHPHDRYTPSGRRRAGLGYWVLTLDCGHVTERPRRRAEASAPYDADPHPPTRVRCEDCAPSPGAQP